MNKQVLIAGACALALAACEQPQTSDVTAEDLMNVDRDFSTYAVDNGPYAAWDRYFTDESVSLEEGKPPAIGKPEILAGFEDWPANLTISWEPFGGDVAKSGDLGYTWGRYLISGLNPDGSAVNVEGKYVSVWERQENGQWKIVLDGGSSNGPVPEVPDAEGEGE